MSAAAAAAATAAAAAAAAAAANGHGGRKTRGRKPTGKVRKPASLTDNRRFPSSYAVFVSEYISRHKNDKTTGTPTTPLSTVATTPTTAPAINGGNSIISNVNASSNGRGKILAAAGEAWRRLSETEKNTWRERAIAVKQQMVCDAATQDSALGANGLTNGGNQSSEAGNSVNNNGVVIVSQNENAGISGYHVQAHAQAHAHAHAQAQAAHAHAQAAQAHAHAQAQAQAQVHALAQSQAQENVISRSHPSLAPSQGQIIINTPMVNGISGMRPAVLGSGKLAASNSSTAVGDQGVDDDSDDADDSDGTIGSDDEEDSEDCGTLMH